MEKIQQLVDLLAPLFLGALPTTLLVFFLFFFLRWAFWRPLERVLAERQRATEGAHRQAEAILKTTAEKLHEYEEALRHARADIYREQEASRQVALDERQAILQETRRQANQKLIEAKQEIARDAEQARNALEVESKRLADEIARALLAPAQSSGGPGGRPGGKAQ